MPTQAEKGQRFRELHARPGLLLLPNPWDAGTAKLLQSLGFEALATTSLGMSNALGRVDGDSAVSRDELLQNCRVISQATDLPVNADLENGYADDPKEAATILRDAAERVGHAEAGRRQRLEAQRLQQLGGAGVPRVGQQQDPLPGVQFTEDLTFFGLRAHETSIFPSS